MNKRKTCLLIKLSSLGDILQTTPLIEALSGNYRILMMTFASNRHLVANNPHLTAVIPLYEMRLSLCLPLNIIRNLLVFLRLLYTPIHVSINCHKKYVFNHISRLIFIRSRYGLIRDSDIPQRTALTEGIKFNQKEHHIDQYLKFAELLNIIPVSKQMKYYPGTGQNSDDSYNLTSLYICCCPGGGANPWASMPSKRWPAEHYINFFKHLNKLGIGVCLMGGPDDQDLNESIMKQLDSTLNVNVTATASLDELFLLIDHASLYVGNDSFLLHFASTTTTPTLGLFGPTRGSLLNPLGANHHFIQSTVNCSGCYDANQALDSVAYHCRDHHCMKEIPVEKVLKVARSLINQSTSQINST